MLQQYFKQRLGLKLKLHKKGVQKQKKQKNYIVTFAKFYSCEFKTLKIKQHQNKFHQTIKQFKNMQNAFYQLSKL